MKIFWSWQSDTDGKTGRFFVRDALEEAIKQLKQPPDVEEPDERDLHDGIHLDHDRKDISGTPSIAEVIFKKINKGRKARLDGDGGSARSATTDQGYTQ